MKLEDLKVGQYVRFKDKKENTYIRKIKEVCTKYPEKRWGAIIVDKNANNVPCVSKKNIIKASFNIIDILEVGDYVNGYKVVDIKIFSDGNKYVVIATEEHQSFWKDKVFEDNIKSIVTHEQMEQMSYKLGE